MLVACSDVVIAPSLAEGFGSVHSEVCSMGKPLLTTQVAAIPEVVSGEVIFVSPASSDAIIEGFEKWRTGDFCSLQKKDFSREKSLAHILLLYSKFLKSQ
ncbi:glycosyltransferase family 4 protein [bacterium]|nr:glycosyltransferase family 4 protein [bacterium]